MNKGQLFLLLLLIPLGSFAMECGSSGGGEKRTPETPLDIARGREKILSGKALVEFLAKTPISKAMMLLSRVRVLQGGDRSKARRALSFEMTRVNADDERIPSLSQSVGEAFVDSLPFIDVPISQREILQMSRFRGSDAFLLPESSAEAIMLLSALPTKLSPVRSLRCLAERFPSTSIAGRLSFIVNLSHILHQTRGGGGHCIPFADERFEELKKESSLGGVVPVRSCVNNINFIGSKTLFPRGLPVQQMVEELRSKYFSGVVRAQSNVDSARGFVGIKSLYQFDDGYYVETLEVPEPVGVKVATAYPIFSLIEWQSATSICIADFEDLLTQEHVCVTLDSDEIRDMIRASVNFDRASTVIFERDGMYICDIGPELKRRLEGGVSHHDYRLPPNSIYIVIPKKIIDGWFSKCSIL